MEKNHDSQYKGMENCQLRYNSRILSNFFQFLLPIVVLKYFKFIGKTHLQFYICNYTFYTKILSL